MDEGEFKQSIKESWYEDAINYWSSIPSTVDGMLGGLGQLDLPEAFTSRQLLAQLADKERTPLATPLELDYALDCGAGIGRVTKNALSHYFKKVDLLEQNPKFLERAPQIVPSEVLGELFPIGLQDFDFPPKRYNCIWLQWVVGHLHDDHFIKFFNKAKAGLKEGGVIIIKDNVSKQGYEMDDEDSSVTRSDAINKELFEKSNLKLVYEKIQPNLPKNLYTVKM
jgi:protein N-terminal methyltransferase